jgi:hypothetical protein
MTTVRAARTARLLQPSPMADQREEFDRGQHDPHGRCDRSSQNRHAGYDHECRRRREERRVTGVIYVKGRQDYFQREPMSYCSSAPRTRTSDSRRRCSAQWLSGTRGSGRTEFEPPSSSGESVANLNFGGEARVAGSASQSLGGSGVAVFSYRAPFLFDGGREGGDRRAGFVGGPGKVPRNWSLTMRGSAPLTSRCSF